MVPSIASNTINNSQPSSNALSVALSEHTRPLDEAISELMATRGEIHLAGDAPEVAIRDFILARQFNTDNARAVQGQATAESHPFAHQVLGGELNSTSPVSLISLTHFRNDSGYRVMATYPDNNFDEDHRPLIFFPDTPEGRRGAIDYAKWLGRAPHERRRLDSNYQIDDPDFSASVQRFHCLVETIAVIAPQERPNAIGFPFLPIPKSAQHAVVAPIKTLGRWNCLVAESLGTEPASTDKIECQIQSTEAFVNAAVATIELADIVQFFSDRPDFPLIYERLFVACQCSLKVLANDDLARTLLDVPELPVESASKLAGMLQKAHLGVFCQVLERGIPDLEQFPEEVSSQWKLDLQTYIYESLLLRISHCVSHERREIPDLVNCA